MKKIILFFLTFSQLYCFSSPKLKKNTAQSINLSVSLKQNFNYNKKDFYNPEKSYCLKSKIQPLFELSYNHNYNNKIEYQAAFSVSSSKYRINIDYNSSSTQYNFQFGAGILAFKMPFRLYYRLNSKFQIGYGIALNYNSFALFFSKSNSSSGIDDSTEFFIKERTSDFKDFVTFSNQIILKYNLHKRFSLHFIADFDFGHYPYLSSNILVQNYYTKEKINLYECNIKPQFFYVSIGLSKGIL